MEEIFLFGVIMHRRRSTFPKSRHIRLADLPVFRIWVLKKLGMSFKDLIVVQQIVS